MYVYYSLLILLISLVTSSAADWRTSALARFKFGMDGIDSLGNCPDADLKRVTFKNGSMYLNGNYEHVGGTGNGYRANVTIPALSLDQCTFTVDIWPVDFSQKLRWGFPRKYPVPHGPLIAGGMMSRWLVLDHSHGYLTLTLNNHAITNEFRSVVIEPRKWHNLICSIDRPAKEVRLIVDGRELPLIKLGNDFHWETYGTNRADLEKSLTFQDYSRGFASHAYVANLKVFGDSLNPTELRELAAENKAEQPRFKPTARKR